MPILTEETQDLILPKFYRVQQKFNNAEIIDIPTKLLSELRKNEIRKLIKPGTRVAVAIGSRGIYGLDIIAKTLIDELKNLDAIPYIIPAMGSHGGATALGQVEVLSNYGINEETMGVPIISSMEVVQVGKSTEGVPVYFDKIAYESDIVIPIARVKPHTDFKGIIESGLCKMLVIGLGKHRGCSRMHQEGFDSFAELIPECANIIINNAPISFGIAIIENAYDHTLDIECVKAGDILDREPKLLEKAKKAMPSLLFDEIDILIVEEIGKDITGAGMDPNIIGRTTKGMLKGFMGPKIQRIIILRLSEATHGNACGIGLADYTLSSILREIDNNATYANVIASGNPEAGRIPVALATEDEAIKAAIATCIRIDVSQVKIVKIKNTLSLGEVCVSEYLLEEVNRNPDLELMT